jgi:preprotein translocase subunit Sec63
VITTGTVSGVAPAADPGLDLAKHNLACSYYTVLGVSVGASDRQIERAYREMLAGFHPDNLAASRLEYQHAVASLLELSKVMPQRADVAARVAAYGPPRMPDDVGACVALLQRARDTLLDPESRVLYDVVLYASMSR